MAPPKEADRRSLDTQVYRQVRDMIVQGVLQPGEQLVQETIAEHLGVSRTPIRKAIAELATENFVEMTSRGTAYVRTFSAQELASIWEIRAVLEGLVCRLAVERIEPQHIVFLRSLITNAAAAITPHDWSRYREADQEFHRYLARIVDDPLLARILDTYQILSVTLAQGLLRPPSETLLEHLDILNALDRGNADWAEEAMVSHIRSSLIPIREEARKQVAIEAQLPRGFRNAVREPLSRLLHAYNETVGIAARHGDEAVLVRQLEATRPLRAALEPDARLPFGTTAVGQVLADPEKPHAFEDETYQPGLKSLAVPLHDGDGNVIAALGLWAPAIRFDERPVKAWTSALQTEAGHIQKALTP